MLKVQSCHRQCYGLMRDLCRDKSFHLHALLLQRAASGWITFASRLPWWPPRRKTLLCFLLSKSFHLQWSIPRSLCWGGEVGPSDWQSICMRISCRAPNAPQHVNLLLVKAGKPKCINLCTPRIKKNLNCSKSQKGSNQGATLATALDVDRNRTLIAALKTTTTYMYSYNMIRNQKCSQRKLQKWCFARSFESYPLQI